MIPIMESRPRLNFNSGWDNLQNSILLDITKTVERDIEAGSIIITYEGICQNLDVYDRWKLVDISILLKASMAGDKKPMKPIRNEYASKVYNSPYGDEYKDQLIKNLSQWSSGKIYMIAYRNYIEIIKKLIGDRFTINKKALIEMANFDFPVPDKGRKQIRVPRGPNYIFDLEIRREPLVVVELTIKGELSSQI
jgi:hypothetical protein